MIDGCNYIFENEQDKIYKFINKFTSETKFPVVILISQNKLDITFLEERHNDNIPESFQNLPKRRSSIKKIADLDSIKFIKINQFSKRNASKLIQIYAEKQNQKLPLNYIENHKLLDCFPL